MMPPCRFDARGLHSFYDFTYWGYQHPRCNACGYEDVTRTLATELPKADEPKRDVHGVCWICKLPLGREGDEHAIQTPAANGGLDLTCRVSMPCANRRFLGTVRSH